MTLFALHRARRGVTTLALCALLSLASLAQGGPASEADLGIGARARSQSYPVSIALPEGWESFQGDPKSRGEVLFLQSPEQGAVDATLTLSAYPLPHAWDDLLRRETYQLVVDLDAPVLANQALTLRGAKGHKWVYKALSAKGELKVYYRVYLALPATVGGSRLLVLQASAPADQSEAALSLFNSLTRTLSWGSDAAPTP